MKELPEAVQRGVGRALQQVQLGEKPASAKPLSGFGGASVLEIKSHYDGDTFRAVYTVRFAERVYVLHVFQKKSKRGSEISQQDMKLIRERLKVAETLHQAWEQSQKDQ